MTLRIESPDPQSGEGTPAPWISEASIWQEVESGGYRIDLPIWTELTVGSKTPILDLGCGTGRVARHLAKAGHRVTGIELDPGIAADFRRMASDGKARVLVGDALALDRMLPGPDRFDFILLPQQLLQIIGDRSVRSRTAAAVKRRLTPGGIAAFTLVPNLPEISLELDLPPDELHTGGWSYISRPVSIEAADDRIELTRIRERISPSGRVAGGASVVTFRRLDPEVFYREARQAGLVVLDSIAIPATAEHTDSVIVLCAPGGQPRSERAPGGVPDI